jgi:hypothetical protein
MLRGILLNPFRLRRTLEFALLSCTTVVTFHPNTAVPTQWDHQRIHLKVIYNQSNLFISFHQRPPSISNSINPALLRGKQGRLPDASHLK